MIPKQNALLVRAVRAAICPHEHERPIEMGAGTQDWNALAASAVSHKVLPLVYRGLSTGLIDAPPAILDELRQRAHPLARASLRQAAELVRVTLALRDKGIAALPVKGPILSQRLYGDLGARQFHDLDLLVRPGEFPVALALLEDNDYEVTSPSIALSDTQRAAQIRVGIGYHVQLRHKTAGHVLELHWALFHGTRYFSTDSDSFWSGLESTTLAGTELPDLPDDGLLRYLCLHGTKDGWRRLATVADVAAALDRLSGIGWDQQLDHASRNGELRAVLLGPYLANRLFGTPLPAVLVDAIDDERAILESALHRRGPFNDPTPLAIVRYELELETSLIGKLWVLQQNLVKPKASTIEALVLPAMLFPLYFVVRPVLLAWKHLRNAFSRASELQPPVAS